MKKRLTICFMAVFLISSIGYAQVTTSSIHGNVYDENNQPLPDASVVAVHTPTGTKYGSTTNFDGVVNLRNLRVGGPYTISISYLFCLSLTNTDAYLKPTPIVWLNWVNLVLLVSVTFFLY